MSYQEVRGNDGRLLFRYDPDRQLVEIKVDGRLYVVDLTAYAPEREEPAVIENDPLKMLTF